jgi:perosamine synthetase
MPKIPLVIPELNGQEEAYVVEAIRSSWISSTGPFVERFEQEFAQACGTRTAISVCNGTAALHLALMAMDLQPGDEVIVPSLSFVATANACCYVNAIPVFVDVEPSTWCLDPSKLEASLTSRTRGIIAVHLYGHPADMDAINQIAERHGLWVIEDAAEAPFALYKDRPTGGLARIGTFSFYGNKILTSGEGGALTVNDPKLDSRLRLLRGQGMDTSRRYFFPVIGNNFRLTNVACALLCAQLERRDQLLSSRRAIFASYREQLSAVPGLVLLPHATWATPAPWLFSLLVQPAFGCTRDELAAGLATAGIDTRPLFIPLHTLPPYQKHGVRCGRLTVTEQLADQGLTLPTYPSLAPSQVDFICDTIKHVHHDATASRR